jgi:hypothetical protein
MNNIFRFPSDKRSEGISYFFYSLLVIKLMLTCIINIHTKSEPEVEVMLNDQDVINK